MTTPVRSLARQATDVDLVAQMMTAKVGSSARRKAARLLSDLGGLSGLARVGEAARLLDFVEPVAAKRIAAALELGLRCSQPSNDRPVVVASSDDIARLLGPKLRPLMHEQVWVVGLDARNAVTSQCRIAEGGQHGCALLARDVLRAVIQLGAQSFVMVHNHPGGDPRPSAEDVHMTEQIGAASVCVGVPLIDHVIVTRNGHSSLLRLGLIPDLGENTENLPRHARVANPANVGKSVACALTDRPSPR